MGHEGRRLLEGRCLAQRSEVQSSVGSTGNSSGIGNYSSLGKTGSTLYNTHSGWVLSSPANEELGWETQIQANVGFSARLFRPRESRVGLLPSHH